MDRQSKSQIFIRNLPFDATSEDLIQVFEDIGPIKRASIAEEKGKSKGFGFIKFSLDEDAIKAMESKNKFILRGRTLQLDSAVIKPRKDRRNAEDSATMTQPESTPVENLVEDKNEKVPSKVVTKEITEAPAKTAKVSPKTAATVKPVTNTEATEPKDETATGDQKSPTPSTSVSRSLKYVAFGLPETINKKDFKKVSSKACRKAEIAPINQTDPLYESIKVLEPPGKIFLMSIPSRKNIEKLVDFFKTTTTGSFESSASEGTAAARKGGKKIQLRSMADVTELHLRKKKCRLILRNLSFQATEQNILDRLSQFGPIVDVMIPKVEVQKTSKRKRRQSTEDEEETQVEADNITKLQPRGFGFITFLCARDAIAAVEAGTGIKICNREVAVDFCASKAVHDKILKGGFATNPYSVDSDLVNADVEPKQVIDEDEVDDNDDNDADVDAEDEENDDGEMDDNDEDEDEDDENDDADDEDNDEDEQETETEKPKVSDAAEMKTVFLRELAFDSTEKDIRDSLRVFGKISLAILVKDKETGISKGSAFVKFFNAEDAQKCVEAFQLSRGSVLIKDRECRADLAVDKGKLEQIKTERDMKTKRPNDKRNLFLANEGLVLDESKLANPIDQEKRKKAQTDKRKKLTNPLFFVSAHRVSIRNLPKSMGDFDLKIMCLKAAKAGLANNLVTSKDIDAYSVAQGSGASNVAEVSPSFSKTAVTSAKVMLDLAKVKNGIPQSKRYGFVEFKDHAHALACVRELSHSHDFLQYLPALQREMLASPQSSAPTAASDPTGGGKLLVEFCLENQRKVQVLKKRTENNESFKKQKTQESIPNFNKQELTTKSTSRSVVEAATFSSKQKVDESSYEMMDEDISQNGTETEVEVEPTEGKKRRDSRQQLKKASSKVKRKKIVSKRKENEKKRKESKKLTKK